MINDENMLAKFNDYTSLFNLETTNLKHASFYVITLVKFIVKGETELNFNEDIDLADFLTDKSNFDYAGYFYKVGPFLDSLKKDSSKIYSAYTYAKGPGFIIYNIDNSNILLAASYNPLNSSIILSLHIKSVMLETSDEKDFAQLIIPVIRFLDIICRSHSKLSEFFIINSSCLEEIVSRIVTNKNLITGKPRLRLVSNN